MSEAAGGRRRGGTAAAAEPRPSVLDRLLPEDGERGNGAGNVERLRHAVRRDLERLFNARLPWRTAPDRFGELARSAYGYGMPDFTGLVLERHEDREMIRLAIAALIERFEPRLSQVRVSLREPDRLRPVLNVRVDAVLAADPARTPYAVETALLPPDCSVRLAGRGKD